VRDAFWIGVIVAALAAIAAGYVQAVVTTRPPPVATLRANTNDAGGLGESRAAPHLPDWIANDAFAQDDVVVERARPVAPAWRREQLAIFVGLCGRSVAAESGFLRLGIPLAFVVDPQAAQARAFAQLVRDAGDALYVQVAWPPGGAALRRFRGALGSFDGLASRNAGGMAAALRGSGLAFFDERGNAAQPLEFAAAGVPLIRRDVTADDRGAPGYVAFMLARAADLSRRTGPVVVFVRPLPSTLEALRAFGGSHPVDFVAAAAVR